MEMLKKYAITSSKAWELSKLWLQCSIIWRILDHVFTIVSFAASIATIYIVSEFGLAQKILIITLPALSAVLTLVSFACNPGKYMSNYRAAYQILNAALVENTNDTGEFKDEDARTAVIKAIQEGEAYIGRTYDTELTGKNKGTD